MGAFGGITLTNKGRNLLAKAQTGVEIKYTRFGIGDGQLGGQSIVDLNALISQKQSLGIAKLKVQPGGKAVVGTVITNKNLTTGFYFREVGIFAQDPTEGEILFGYANCGPTAEYIPVGGGQDAIEKTFDIIIIIGNAPNVSAVLDSSLVWETPDGAQEKVDTHAKNTILHVTQTDKDKWNALYSTPLANGTPSKLIIGGTSSVGVSNAAARADHKHEMPTATDVLNALKGVDGTGSGLDADLLDGLQASEFFRSIRDPKTALGATDWNAVVEPGVYCGTGLSNAAPISATYAYCIVSRWAAGNTYAMQLMVDFYESAVWSRVLVNNAWQPWVPVSGRVSIRKYASDKDSIVYHYRVVDWKRKDNTLYMKTVFSNPDSNGFLRTLTKTYYANDGTTVLKSESISFTYDQDGMITSEIPNY